MQPGDIFFTQISGPGGWLIRLAQGLTGDWSRYTHVGIVLDDGTVIAAQPGGARIDPIETILFNRPLAYTAYDLPDEHRRQIVRYARSLKGTPYSFLDYLSLALLHAGIRPKWLRDFVKNSGHMICSQFVDHVYAQRGVHLFDDGRLSQDVTPGDVAHCGTIQHAGTGPWFYLPVQVGR